MSSGPEARRHGEAITPAGPRRGLPAERSGMTRAAPAGPPDGLPGEPPGADAATLAHALSADLRRVVVLDDDPTGSQSAAGVEVILRPQPGEFTRFFAGGDRACYVLTNSRALPREGAVHLVAGIRRVVESAARAAGREVAFVLRGDSTLRGHVFAETDAIAPPGAVVLFVPAFPDGGRRTVGGVHYLDQEGTPVPVSETEFAADPVFGYRSRRLADWVREAGGPHRAAQLVTLGELRAGGPGAVAGALRAAPAGTVVIPDAASEADIRAIVIGLLDAERSGKPVVVRSAATFAALRAGARSPGLLTRTEPAGGPVLIVCGSHTAASTRQLSRLGELLPAPVVLPDEAAAGDPCHAARLLAPLLRQRLADRGAAILATQRHRRPEHSSLDWGARVMAALTAVVAQVGQHCAGVIAKGGITSAEVAVRGLGARRARVRGQLLPGVSLWDLDLDGRTLPYVVVPGNVGDDSTLVTLAGRLGAIS
jgi:uncharacterized protein YgbK (DUF1537 family)